MKTPSKRCLVTQSKPIYPLYYEMGHSLSVPWSPWALGASDQVCQALCCGWWPVCVSFCDTHGWGLGIPASQGPALHAPSPRGSPLTPLSVPAPGSISFVIGWFDCSFPGVTGKEAMHCLLPRRANVSVCHSSWRPWPGTQPTRH